MIKFCQIILFFFFYLQISILHASQAYCVFDADIRKIYAEIINLDLDLARISIGNKADTSLNKAYLLLENEIDFYSLFIYEQKSEYENKKSFKSKRLNLIKHSDLPLQWKRFLQAEILLQWSLIHLKQEDEFRSFQSIRESIQLLEDNANEFPDFMYTYKSLGILHTLMSTIPAGFQWAAWLLGMKAQLLSGKVELQKYIQYAEPRQDLFLDESYAAMGFIIAYLENKPESAYQYWTRKTGDKSLNALHTLVHSKLAIKAGFNDDAIRTIESLRDLERDKLPLLYFLLGQTSMQKLNLKADQHFHKFLNLHKGSTYIKESYQKLAWISLLKGEPGLYRLYISNCLIKGNAFNDEDRQAKQEALSGKIPDLYLLKARLLFDGGYMKQADEMLSPRIEEYYANPDKKLECAYRLGRICQMNKQPARALQFYNDALHFDPQNNSFMSCNALLQSGIIFESLQKKDDSFSYFKKVLQTNPDQYKRSLHQKAKAGIARLNGSG